MLSGARRIPIGSVSSTWLSGALKCCQVDRAASVVKRSFKGENFIFIYQVELNLHHTQRTSTSQLRIIQEMQEQLDHCYVFVNLRTRNSSLPTWAGTIPSLRSTSGRVCLCPTNTRLNCSIGLPSLLLRDGRSTHTLGRLPSPTRSNSSSLLLNGGVILNQMEKKKKMWTVMSKAQHISSRSKWINNR